MKSELDKVGNMMKLDVLGMCEGVTNCQPVKHKFLLWSHLMSFIYLFDYLYLYVFYSFTKKEQFWKIFLSDAFKESLVSKHESQLLRTMYLRTTDMLTGLILSRRTTLPLWQNTPFNSFLDWYFCEWNLMESPKHAPPHEQVFIMLKWAINNKFVQLREFGESDLEHSYEQKKSKRGLG